MSVLSSGFVVRAVCAVVANRGRVIELIKPAASGSSTITAKITLPESPAASVPTVNSKMPLPANVSVQPAVLLAASKLEPAGKNSVITTPVEPCYPCWRNSSCRPPIRWAAS